MRSCSSSVVVHNEVKSRHNTVFGSGLMSEEAAKLVRSVEEKKKKKKKKSKHGCFNAGSLL